MKKLQLLIFLFFLPIATSLVFCTEFVKAETPPDIKVNEDVKTAVSKDINTQSPRIFFKSPNFDFGKIYKGQKVEHIFKFENQGNTDLNISKVKTSCGCTAAILTNKTIPAGKTGEIKTTFNSGSYKGKVTKSITVKSNDPGSPNYTLTISGVIAEIITTSPGKINFGSVYLGAETDKTITVSSDSSFIIKKITPSKPFLNASITEKKESEYTIKITSKGNNEIGRYSGVINLETDNKIQPKLKIPFFGDTMGDITTYPSKIYYGHVKKGKERVQRVFVKFNKEKLEILDVKVTPDYLSTKIIENYKKNNAQFLIEVKLHENAAIGKIKGLLEINTDSKAQPNIKVPITGEVS